MPPGYACTALPQRAVAACPGSVRLLSLLRARLRLCALLLAGSLPGWAGAQCSRPVTVPAAPTGQMVIVEGSEARGALVSLLREMGRGAGCEFAFPVMPRARANQEVLEAGRMDVLIPAGRNSQRDRNALFVPLLREQVALVVRSADQVRAPSSVAQLRERTTWRGALVRSYAFNDAYVELMNALRNDKRVDFVVDPVQALRMLHAGRVQFLLLPPTSMNEEGGSLRRGLALVRLTDLPPMEAGAYLSRLSLSEADRQWLADQLLRAARDGRVRRAMASHYPADLLDWGQR